jgi:hypothetical protein
VANPPVVVSRILRDGGGPAARAAGAAVRQPRVGLWTEVRRAYAFCEDSFVIWRYETGTGLVTLPSDTPLRSAITAVGLVVPRAGKFDAYTRVGVG